MNPNPSNYRSLTAYRAAQALHPPQQPKQAMRRINSPTCWLILAAVVTALLILLCIHSPWVGLSVAGLIALIALKLWLDCWRDTRDYRDEQDL